MTISWLSNNATIGKSNSKNKPTKSLVQAFNNDCDAIIISCRDDKNSIAKAKETLIKMSSHLKFAQTEPREIGSKYENSTQFVCNRNEFVGSDDSHVDDVLDFMMGG